MSGTAEPRAKRTHARRSCDVCKLRKTRCELPDLDVPSSSQPLPLDKSCHRCKILAIPCIVDDSSRKFKKRPRDDRPMTINQHSTPPVAGPSSQPTAQATPPPPPPPPPSNPKRKDKKSKSNSGSHALKDVDHFLNVMHGFHPSQHPPMWSLPEGQGQQQQQQQQTQNDDTRMPPFGSSEPAESFQSKSMRLHGRPLELVCAMLGVAHGKGETKRRGLENVHDLDLELLVDHDLRIKLEPG